MSRFGATRSPILVLSAVNITSGKTAKGNCRLSTTCVRINSWAVPDWPNQIVTLAAYTIAIARVMRRRNHGASFMSRKPSITIWPASIAVTVELIPQHNNAMPKSVGAIAKPSIGAKRLWTSPSSATSVWPRRGRSMPPGSG